MSPHEEVRELLELAVVEPGGLDRLEAGDTPEAAMVVGHLAGCPDCLEEMARLRRVDTLLRPILTAEPDPALRERTLAHVRAVGVERDPGPQRPRRAIGMPAWVATLAAVLVIGLVGGGLLARNGSSGGGGDTAAALGAVTGETAKLVAADDAREVVLVDASGTPAGTVIFSASEGRLLVTASHLDDPAAGTEYRCWVEVAGARTTIGTMHWASAVAWWTGDVAIPTTVPAGVVYGVSLVVPGSSDPGTVVLTGKL
jgi:hypothetical protein